MSLAAGHKLGPYKIIGAAGTGGMGEVYKAEDTRLERIVAVKVLSSGMTHNPDLRARFEREAKVISGLNHPNICTLHDIGEEDGVDYLVMEYLEGQTLAERMKENPLSINEVLETAVEIADALDKAHCEGLIHRDLKPANVMLTKTGAKLLDFGLAKHQVIDGKIDGVSAITQTTPLTGTGTILGTLHYMSPEQLEGQEADARSDVFAFGALLYEMITGQRSFDGNSQAGLIAAILEREPVSITQVKPTAPPGLDRLVRKCLAKDPDKRWQSSRDLSDELRWISQSGSLAGVPSTVARQRRLQTRLAWLLVALTSITSVLAGYKWLSQTAPENLVSRFTIQIKQGLHDVYWPRISPDGKLIAFQAEDSLGINRIWIRTISSLEAYPLLDTDNAKRFFWSPDSRHLAFFVNNQLKRIPVTGGQAQLICEGPQGADGTWGSSDMIVFDGNMNDTMKIVSAGGGLPTAATLVDTAGNELSHAWPWFLPDGRHFIFAADTRRSDAGGGDRIKLGQVGSTESRTLYELDKVDRLEYAPEGYILYVEQENLMALPFDAEALEVTGDPKPIAMRIGTAGNADAFGVSDNGTLLYHTNTRSSNGEMAWVDRDGERLSTIGQRRNFIALDLSPDETKIAFSAADNSGGALDIWLFDLRRNVPTRLTFDPAIESWPVWSPDGEFVYYVTDRLGTFNIFRKNASGSGEAEVVYETDSTMVGPTHLTPDGKQLLFAELSTVWNIGIVDLDDSSRVDMLANTSFLEAQAQVSPNGEYVAYASNESGTLEIYVRKIDGTGGKWQISTENANCPRWRADGKELYYLTYDDRIMAVEVKTAGLFEAGNPVELFKLPVRYIGNFNFPYDVSSDGQKFLVSLQIGSANPGEIVLVQNWFEEHRE